MPQRRRLWPPWSTPTALAEHDARDTVAFAGILAELRKQDERAVTQHAENKELLSRLEINQTAVAARLGVFEGMAPDLGVLVSERRKIGTIVWGITKTATVAAGLVGLVAGTVTAWPFLRWLLLVIVNALLSHLSS